MRDVAGDVADLGRERDSGVDIAPAVPRLLANIRLLVQAMDVFLNRESAAVWAPVLTRALPDDLEEAAAVIEQRRWRAE